MSKKLKSRREHGNSTWDYDKWKKLIDLIKIDVDQKKACAYVGLPVSTLHDWLKRDKNLSEEYHQAETYMDVVTSNALSYAINSRDVAPQDRAKYALEWKKRRDNRYKNKSEISGEDGQQLTFGTIKIVTNETKKDAGDKDDE